MAYFGMQYRQINIIRTAIPKRIQEVRSETCAYRSSLESPSGFISESLDSSAAGHFAAFI